MNDETTHDVTRHPDKCAMDELLTRLAAAEESRRRRQGYRRVMVPHLPAGMPEDFRYEGDVW